MKKFLRHWRAALTGTAALLLLGSCAYDPYYSSGADYGYVGGYGGSSYSTSVFISTGDSRWGYDPYCHSYYDYNRRAYYDPYLYGYYPVGFRPPIVIGAPHPYGWRPGRGYCPPPRRVSGVILSNYRNRENAYRRSNYSWASQVRQRDSGSSFRPESRTAQRADNTRRFGPGDNSRNRYRDGNGNSFQRPATQFDTDRSSRSNFIRPQESRRVPDRSDGFQGRSFQENRRSESPSRYGSPGRVAPSESPSRREAPQRTQAPVTRIQPAPSINSGGSPERSARQNGGGGGARRPANGNAEGNYRRAH